MNNDLRRFLLICSFFISYQIGFGQCEGVTNCDDGPNIESSLCGTPLNADNCADAPNPSICELDGFSACTACYGTGPADAFLTGFCGPGTGTSNTMWIGFTAATTNVNIFFDVGDCFNNQGIQAAIIETDCSSFANTLGCVGGVTVTNTGATQPFNLTAANLTVGDPYYIMIDGYAADFCAFTLQVIEGLPDPSFNASITVDKPICGEGDFATLTASPLGSYVYEWIGPNGVIPGETGPFLQTDVEGEYSVIVRELSECCQAEGMGTVEVVLGFEPLVVNASNDLIISCDNPEITLMGDFSPREPDHDYETNWLAENGDNLCPNGCENITVSSPETYTFFVQDLTTGCNDFIEVEVTGNTVEPTVAIPATGSLDCGATFAIDGGTGTMINSSSAPIYEWTVEQPDGTQVPTTDMNGIESILEVDVAGIYTLTVTDPENGCTASASTEVTSNAAPPEFTIEFTDDIDTVDCNNENVQVNIAFVNAPPSNATFNWENESGIQVASTQSFTTMAAGIFAVTVTDEDNNCPFVVENIEVFEITEAPIANAGDDAAIQCVGGSNDPNVANGPSTVTLMGMGEAPSGDDVSVAWLNASGTVIANFSSVAVTTPGIYTFRVTNDVTGCSSSDDVQVTNGADLPMAMAGDDATLTCNTTSVDLMGSASGGTNYTYEWFNSAGVSQGTGANFTATAADTYTLNVVNSDNNCLATDQVVVDLDDTAPSLAVNGNQPITCTQTEITLTANSTTAQGTPTFAWSTTENSAGIMVGAGTYTVTVTDGVNGCTNEETVTVVSDLTAPTANAGADMVLNCLNNQIVILEGSDDAGLPNVEYQWQDTGGSNISMNENQAATVAGTYTLIITNTDTGCTDDATVNVTSNLDEPQDVTADDGTITCLTGEYTLNGSTSSTNVSTMWTGPGGYTSMEANPVVTSPGTYTFVVTNNTSGCSATADAVVINDDSVPQGPTATSNVMFDVLNCNQESFEFTGVNNETDPGIVLSWTLPDETVVNSDVVTVDQAGVYTVTATAPNGCFSTGTYTVVNDFDPPVIDDITGGTINCDDETIDLGLTTSNNVDYEWSGAGLTGSPTDPTPTVNLGGMYTVTITDSANGCTAEGSVMVMEDNAEPMAMLTPATTTTISCFEPTLTLNGSSPTAGVTYQWSNNEETASIDVTTAGTYSLTVTGSNSCTSTATLMIDDITSTPTATTTGDVLDCNNNATAQLEAMTDAVNPSYEWTLAGGTFTSNVQSPTTTEAGVYTVTITDTDNGCTNTATYEVVDQTTAPDLSDVTGGMIDCNTTEIVLGAESTTAGVTYTWTGPGISMTNMNEQNPTVTQPGDYAVVVEDPSNGCTSTMPAIVDIDDSIPVATATGGTINCNNQMTGIQISGSSSVDGVSYAWTGPDNFTSDEQNPTVTDVGQYILTITDPSNGCAVEATTDVLDDTSAPEGVMATGGVLSCAEECITLTGTSTTDDVTYLWSGGSIDATNENEQNPKVTMTDTYTLTVISNTNGCETTTTAAVTPDAMLPNATATSVGLANLDCGNVMMGIQLDGSSTTMNTTVEWIYPDEVTTTTDPMPFVMDTGTYTLVVTSLDNGCTNTSTVGVNGDFDPPVITIMTPDTLTCTENSITIMASSDDGGAGFLWTGAGIDNVNDEDPTPNVDQAGIYEVTVTGTNDCVAIQSVEVIADEDIPVAMVVSELDSITCTNTTVNLDGTGSDTGVDGEFEYSWEDNAGMEVGTELITPVSTPGAYTLFITNTDNGCTNQADMVVDINTNPPTAEAGDPQTYTCSTTSLTVDGGGSAGQGTLSYEWVGINMEQTAEIFGAGTYELIVTDAANGCTAADEVIIVPDENAPTASATSSNTLTCENLVSTLDGSTSNSVSGADLTYQWTLNGIPVGDTETIEVSEPGNYILIVTDQDNGCTDSDIDFSLGQNITPPAISIATPDILDCTDQSTNLDATESPTGNYAYLWDTQDGSIVQGETTLEPLVDDAGTYTLVITDNDNGCTSTDFIVVQEDVNIPSVNIDPANVFTCSEDEVSLNSTVSPASSNYSYNWSGPSINSDASNANINITEAGTYELLVTNTSTGCTETESIDVPPNTAEILDADLLVTPESCVGDENGLIAIEEVIGGSAPYIYSLDGGFLGQTPVFSSLSPGTYALAIQDVDGCDYETNVTIGVGNDVTIELGPDITLELGDSLTLNPQVSNIIDTITWTGAALEGNTPTFTPTNTLTYTATVVDTFGCIDTDEITIFVERNRDVFIPNAFSPNNDDGNNEIFTIYGGNSVANIKTFRVFDRWGAEVFGATDFLPETMGWDGRHNNREMKPAVFVYYAEIEFKDGLTEIFKGDVILMR